MGRRLYMMMPLAIGALWVLGGCWFGSMPVTPNDDPDEPGEGPVDDPTEGFLAPEDSSTSLAFQHFQQSGEMRA